MDDWHMLLRQVRNALGLSRAELAAHAGVSAETVRAYEEGRRKPSLGTLSKILTALKCPAAHRNDILLGAGFAPPGTDFPPEVYPGYFYSADELPEVVERVAWPEFVLDDRLEVIAANSLMQALWGVDLAEERSRRSRVQMNILAVASERRFIDRIVDWDESVGVLASVLKGGPNQRSLDSPDSYFNAVLDHFVSGDPGFLARLIDVWNRAPPLEPRCRWTYPVRGETRSSARCGSRAWSTRRTSRTASRSTTGSLVTPRPGRRLKL